MSAGWWIRPRQSIVLVNDHSRTHCDARGNKCDHDPFVVPEPLDTGEDDTADETAFQEPQHRSRVFLLLVALLLQCTVHLLQIREDLLS